MKYRKNINSIKNKGTNMRYIKRCGMLIVVPCAIFAMEKGKDFEKKYNQFKLKAMKQLSAEEREAISLDKYKSDREAGIHALKSFAQKTITLAHTEKSLHEKKLIKKTDEYTQYLVQLRDTSVGLNPLTIVHDEITAKVVALSKMPAEETKYFQSSWYHADKEKAFQAIEHFAQLTRDELAKHGLLKTPAEEYERSFIADKKEELENLYTN
jgi:hypothetical protein